MNIDKIKDLLDEIDYAANKTLTAFNLLERIAYQLDDLRDEPDKDSQREIVEAICLLVEMGEYQTDEIHELTDRIVKTLRD